jgi:hypothetical protein
MLATLPSFDWSMFPKDQWWSFAGFDSGILAVDKIKARDVTIHHPISLTHFRTGFALRLFCTGVSMRKASTKGSVQKA